MSALPGSPLATAGVRSTCTLSDGTLDGTGRQSTGTGGEFVYPPGSTDASGRIGGREVRCLTPELLVTFHLGYEPRDIDRRDMAALAERFWIRLPDPY